MINKSSIARHLTKVMESEGIDFATAKMRYEDETGIDYHDDVESDITDAENRYESFINREWERL